MDSVTQAVLGASIGGAGFAHKLGGRALFFGAVCGSLPDFDVVAGAFGEWQGLVHHRGISHSLLALPLASPLIGWIGWRMAKRRGALVDWMALAFFALVTHPLLDTATAYGTQLLAPLSRMRFAIDAVSIIDPVYTVPLLIAVLLGTLRRVPLVISQRFAQVTLVVTTLYLCFGFVQSQRALAEGLEQLRAQGFRVQRARAFPTLANVLAFRIVARDANGDLRIGHLSLLAPREISFLSVERPPSPLVDRALDSEKGQISAWFMDDLYAAQLVAEGGGTTVRLADARYGGMAHPLQFLWGADFTFEGERLIDIEWWSRAGGAEVRSELSALWRLIIDGTAHGK